MTSLSDLLALADAATHGERATDGEWVTVDVYGDDSVLGLCQMARRLAPDGAAEREADAAFIAACSPEVVKALIRVAEAAQRLHTRHVDGDAFPSEKAELWESLADALSHLTEQTDASPSKEG